MRDSYHRNIVAGICTSPGKIKKGISKSGKV